jgi:hypothetical protein
VIEQDGFIRTTFDGQLTESTVVTLLVLFIHTDENERRVFHGIGHRFEYTAVDIVDVEPHVVVQRLDELDVSFLLPANVECVL